METDLSHLRTPDGQSRLTRDGDWLVAPDGARFPIVEGIPRFVDSDNYAADFGAQWKRHPKTQLDSHSGHPISEQRLDGCMFGELAAVRGKGVLEAGSGAGRFTEVLLKHGAELDSFDFSNAVEANAANNGGAAFTLVQADIRAMPFARGAYDFVLCIGVLQHTPDTEESIAKLWEMVRPGGQLVIDHYGTNMWKQLWPPLGDAQKLYRHFILRMPPEKRFGAVTRFVDFWFPIYWRFRDSTIARKILARISGMYFYYGLLPLSGRDQHYEWALLDTHDGLTDHFKRFRSVADIRSSLEALGATDIRVRKGGNGVEAMARKPACAID